MYSRSNELTADSIVLIESIVFQLKLTDSIILNDGIVWQLRALIDSHVHLFTNLISKFLYSRAWVSPSHSKGPYTKPRISCVATAARIRCATRICGRSAASWTWRACASSSSRSSLNSTASSRPGGEWELFFVKLYWMKNIRGLISAKLYVGIEDSIHMRLAFRPTRLGGLKLVESPASWGWRVTLPTSSD